MTRVKTRRFESGIRNAKERTFVKRAAHPLFVSEPPPAEDRYKERTLPRPLHSSLDNRIEQSGLKNDEDSGE